MKPLSTEIHRTGIHNKDVEIMAIAVAKRMRAKFPDVRIVVPYNFAKPEENKNMDS